ncbi:hypothetical protein, partial [Roseivivax isoporae]
MHLILSPARRDEPLALSRAGDVLTVNGQVLDFGPLPEGATLPRAAIDCRWIAGDVERAADGTLTVPLILPHGPDAPEATRFPDPVTLTADGPVTLPPYDAAPEEDPA